MFISAIATIVAPLAVLVVPGIALVRPKDVNSLLGFCARVLLWSFSLHVVVALAVYSIGGSAMSIMAIIAVITAIAGHVHRKELFTLQGLWYSLAYIVPLVIVFAIFTVPFTRMHNALPTGDIQKTIFWADIIRQTGQMPDYSISVPVLNRDPVDFYTPGLHAVSAHVMSLSPFPLTVVSLFAIAIATSTVFITAGIAKEMFDTKKTIFPAIIASTLALTNVRFLRYLREPGYHFQNSVGELLLFGLLYLGIASIKKWNIADALLVLFCCIALVVTHQFSAFIAVFMLTPVGLTLLYANYEQIKKSIHSKISLPLLGAITLTVVIVGGVSLGLHKKIPHLFTLTPHLLSETPNFSDYYTLMQAGWITVGMGGLLLFTVHVSKRHQKHTQGVAFLLATIALLALTQGPRIGIDIPPIRALFYLAIPLGITGSYLLVKIWRLASFYSLTQAIVAKTAVTALTLTIIITSITTAYAGTSHQASTNSTLLPSELAIIEQLEKKPTEQKGTIVVDDSNKRSSSWLVLSGQPMVTRIASDISRQMKEAMQSPLRKQLYLNQLDYEKMYTLGNWPYVVQLFEKHNVTSITGINGSSQDSFRHNPALVQTSSADDIMLYSPQENLPVTSPTEPSDKALIGWLLHPETLANDIGDAQDTQKSLTASISATRLSAPLFDGNQTYRITTAPQIPLVFNVGSYVGTLWDSDGQGNIDTAVELLVQFAYPVQDVSVKVGNQEIPLNKKTNVIRIPREHVQLDDQGFVTINVLNKVQTPVGIDIIALGLARVP